MSDGDNNNGDPTAEFAKELARQIPIKAVYQDVVAPAATQAGQLAADIVKTIQLALAPFQFLGAYQDRLRNFISTSVGRVPEPRRVSPAAQILGPIVEGVRYEPEGTPIDAMFSELLSRSMDSERVDEAHPSYPLIIKQLSSDEAKILSSLNGQQYDYVYSMPYDDKTRLFRPKDRVLEVDDLPKNDLRFPDNIPFYLEHLNQLGLAGIYQEGNQVPLYESPPAKQIGVRVFSKYRLSPFGVRFVHACIGVSAPASAA
jgi:Abortive infection alpha